jgi:flagellar hook-associated protein 2
MASISSISQIQPTVNNFLNLYLVSDRNAVKNIESAQQDISTRISILTDLKAKLKVLYDRIKSFTDVGAAKKLGSKSAESSDTTIFTATADTTASLGVNTIFVSQIARNDTVVSDRITSSGKDIAEYFEGRTISFSIRVGSESAVTISVDVNNATETNSEILTRIKDAINNSNANVSANVISDTSTTKRLTIVSDETGSSNAIELSDVSSRKFLRYIGMINGGGGRKSASGTSGGYIESQSSNLNAIFTINGIQIQSDDNEITDVLSGVTINLKKAQQTGDSPETLFITQDEETVKEQIEGFIKDYNEVIKYLNEKTSVDPSTNKRGIFSGDFTIRKLIIDLRTLVSGNISTVKSGNPKNLTEIGISIDRSGLLTLGNEDKFNEALDKGATAVTDLFDSNKGIAIRMKDTLESFVATGGIIDDARSASDLKLKSVNVRKSSLENRIKTKETSLRRNYSELQKTYGNLTSQMALIGKYDLNNLLSYGTSSSGIGLDLTI